MNPRWHETTPDIIFQSKPSTSNLERVHQTVFFFFWLSFSTLVFYIYTYIWCSNISWHAYIQHTCSPVKSKFQAQSFISYIACPVGFRALKSRFSFSCHKQLTKLANPLFQGRRWGWEGTHAEVHIERDYQLRFRYSKVNGQQDINFKVTTKY